MASLIESDSGRMSYVGSDGAIGTVGISGKEAVGQILAGGVRDMSTWVNKLYGQAFAAVCSQAPRSPSTSKSRWPSITTPKAGASITVQEKAMRSNSIKGLALAAAVAVLGGCATSKEELLTHSDRTMMDIWQQETGGGGSGTGQVARRQLLDARQSLRRPLTDADVQAAPVEQMRYTRLARNEVYRQFQRLPNPDLVMYVYPHLAGTDPCRFRATTVFRCTSACSTPCPVNGWRTIDALETSLAEAGRIRHRRRREAGRLAAPRRGRARPASLNPAQRSRAAGRRR